MTLDEIERLCEKATLGPWKTYNDDDGEAKGVFSAGGQWTGCSSEDDPYNIVCRMPIVCEVPVEKYGYGSAWASEDNAEFIAASRTLMPKLLAVAKAASEMNDCDISADLYKALQSFTTPGE